MNSIQVASSPIALVELMPSNCSKELDAKKIKGVFDQYKSLVGLTRNAARAFLCGDLPDPLVGENACQIRAVMYCQMAKNESLAIELHAIVDATGRVLDRALFAGDAFGKKRRCSLMDVLKEAEMNIFLSNMMSSIVFGHILTISKESAASIKDQDIVIEESNKYERLMAEGFSRSSAEKMIRQARKTLSESSIDFLHFQADCIDDALERERLISMIQPDQILTCSQMGIRTSRMLPGMQILLASLKVHNMAILLKDRIFNNKEEEVGRVTLLFQPRGENRAFEVLTDLATFARGEPAFIVEGIAMSGSEEPDLGEVASSLVNVGIETVILANSASHSQYGGIYKGVEPPMTKERECLKAIALEKGLCARNPTLCRIYHVFAGLIGQHLSLEGAV